MATPIRGKAIKAGQRASRGANDLSNSSSGMDRAAFGPGGAGQLGELNSSIQSGNDQNTEALGEVKSEMQANNRLTQDLNKNIETLKKLEQAGLLFEFSKFTEFGQTFKAMDKGFEQMSYSLDEIVTRTEAGTRAIVKAITQFHSFMSGDTKPQMMARMDIASHEQTNAVQKHRRIRAAQREFFKEQGLGGTIVGANKKQKKQFDELNRTTSERMERKESEEFKRREGLNKGNKHRWPYQSLRGDGTGSTKGKMSNIHFFPQDFPGGKPNPLQTTPPMPGIGTSPGGKETEVEITKIVKRRVKQLTAEALDMTMELTKDGTKKLKGTGKARRFLSQEEFLEIMNDPKKRDAVLGKDLSDEWANGKSNMSYNPGSGSLMADRKTKKTVSAAQGAMLDVLKEIRDCVCDTFELFKGGSSGMKGREADQEAARVAGLKARSDKLVNRTPRTKANLGKGAAGITGMLMGLGASFGMGGADTGSEIPPVVPPKKLTDKQKKKIQKQKAADKLKKIKAKAKKPGKLKQVVNKISKILKLPGGKAAIEKWAAVKIGKKFTLGWLGPVGFAVGLAWTIYELVNVIEELDEMLADLEAKKMAVKNAQDNAEQLKKNADQAGDSSRNSMVKDLNDPNGTMKRMFGDKIPTVTRDKDGRIVKGIAIGGTLEDAKVTKTITEAEAAAMAEQINSEQNGATGGNTVNAPTTYNNINIYQPPTTTDSVLKKLLGGGIDDTLIIGQ